MSRVSGVWVKTLISNRVRRESSVRIFESVEACTVHSTGVHWLYSCTVAVMYRALQTEAQSPQYRPRLATRLSHLTTTIRRQEDRQSRSLRSYLDKREKVHQHQPLKSDNISLDWVQPPICSCDTLTFKVILMKMLDVWWLNQFSLFAAKYHSLVKIAS